MLYIFLILPILLNPFDLCAKSHKSYQSTSDIAKPYERNPYVDPEVWDELEPYFLPLNHPIRTALDEIFSERVTQNIDSIDAAGFSSSIPQRHNGAIVSKHHKLKGYVVKMFTDDTEIDQDWKYWARRVEGSIAVQQAIMDHGYYTMFKCPRKWIYPLPSEPSPTEGSFRKDFILICENMKILKSSDNYNHWKGPSMTRNRLKAFHIIVEELGLYDSCWPSNVPFCRDGKQAFLDLEHHHEWPIKKKRLKKYLSDDMKIYWDYLINQASPYK